MSDCRVPMDAGATISRLNERNRRLVGLVRRMWRCLLTMPSGWEDQQNNVKNIRDEMRELGVL